MGNIITYNNRLYNIIYCGIENEIINMIKEFPKNLFYDLMYFSKNIIRKMLVLTS